MSQTNISLAQAQGAFYILGIGLVIASLCLVTERIFTLRKCKIRATAKKKTQDSRVNYVGTMAKRVSRVNGVTSTTTFHNPQFASPFEMTNGNLYTYSESSTDNDSSQEGIENAKKRKKSNSCPLLFGSCVKTEKEEYSMQNGLAGRAPSLRSAFSDTLWTKKQKKQNGGTHSNGVIVQNGSINVKPELYAGFTFESIRDSQPSIHNKDEETGEISNNTTFFSIRL